MVWIVIRKHQIDTHIDIEVFPTKWDAARFIVKDWLFVNQEYTDHWDKDNLCKGCIMMEKKRPMIKWVLFNDVFPCLCMDCDEYILIERS